MDLVAWSLVLSICSCTLWLSNGCDEDIMKDIVSRIESLESSNKMLVQNDVAMRRIIRQQQMDIKLLQEELDKVNSKTQQPVEHGRQEHNGGKPYFTENPTSDISGERETNESDKKLKPRAAISVEKINVQGNTQPSLVEEGMFRQIRFPLNSSDIVAFHATINRGEVPHLSRGQMVVFDNVLMNVGAGYHKNAGIFIAPKAGLYIFSVSILSYHVIVVNLEKNGYIMASVYCAGHTPEAEWHIADQGSVTIIADVEIGDEIFAKVDERGGNGETSIYGDNYTSFMGFLLIPK